MSVVPPVVTVCTRWFSASFRISESNHPLNER
jgi:hypothetical protein